MERFIYFGILLVLLIVVLSGIGHYKERRNYPRKVAKSGIREIDSMDGFQFEEYLKVLFYYLGYKTNVTKKAGDFGADLVLEGTDRIVVQAKRYNYKNKVGIAAIQEVYAAKRYYRAREAWVVTNSTYTESAKKLAAVCQVKLIARDDLMNLILKVNPPKK